MTTNGPCWWGLYKNLKKLRSTNKLTHNNLNVISLLPLLAPIQGDQEVASLSNNLHGLEIVHPAMMKELMTSQTTQKETLNNQEFLISRLLSRLLKNGTTLK